MTSAKPVVDEISPLIAAAAVPAMSSLELYSAIAAHYPKYVEGESIAYLEGAARAATLLGLNTADCNGFMSEWSRVDERMFVASLFLAARQKSATFAAELGVKAKSVIIH